MSQSDTVKAGLVIIGNEILSGRTLDKNTQHIALKLGEHGIKLAEVRVVPDILGTVVKTLNEMRSTYDYILTTGGLGPTHDDITVDCIAAAFDVPVITHPEAFRRLDQHYGTADFTEARQRMARTPEGADLIDNPVSTAPGFVIGNVYAMAGVPKIMQAMLDNVLRMVKGGAIMQSRTIGCALPESEIAGTLSALQGEYPHVDIGSYPFFHSGNVGVSVVLRATDESALDQAADSLFESLKEMNAAPKRTD